VTGAFRLLWGLLCFCLSVTIALAERSALYQSPAVDARLIVAEDGVAPDTRFLSAGIQLTLAEGWKTYWRSPGEVGLPPEIDWSASRNVLGAEAQFPAPLRFRAFGIENFGYKDAVTFPIRIEIEDAGAPVQLNERMALLICSDICLPADIELSLALPMGSGIDRAAAAEIATWAARVPVDPEFGGVSETRAHLSADGAALTVELTRAQGWTGPDVFPEYGEYTAFGAPDIRLSPDGTRLWARLPILTLDEAPGDLWLTVTDGSLAVTATVVPLVATELPPPYRVEAEPRSGTILATMLLVAFLGGLILNAMPCVLPVLSIKLASAMKHSDRSAAQVRAGFLMTVLGTMAFFWFLAAVTLALQATGYAVGWGVQFQNPFFLIVLFFVLAFFAANLFGAFEIVVPSGAMTRLARIGSNGYAGDVATGAFAAILATPCSAPLLGTALAFALTGSSIDVVLIFTAMGLGLALPYLAISVWPGLIRALPRPGRWMTGLKIVLGLMLVATAAWIVWVLAGVTSGALALVVTGLVLAAIVVVLQAHRLTRVVSAAALALMAITAIAMPVVLTPDLRTTASTETVPWTTFERAAIPRLVAEGQTVFLDITADWCLTCKANKSLVIDRSPVADVLNRPDVTPMQGDWTRPDPAIQAFLESHDRFGIPFNMVFGPAAPDGILLPEVLTSDSVLEAIEAASTRVSAAKP